jgi:hypothetical protein
MQLGYDRYGEAVYRKPAPVPRVQYAAPPKHAQEDKKRKLKDMVNEISNEEEIKAIQKVLADKLAKIREHKESVSTIAKACEKDAATAASLRSMLDECPICVEEAVRCCGQAVGSRSAAVRRVL